MKKLLSITLIAMLLFSIFTVVSGAEVLEIEDFIAEGNTALVLWDSVRTDDTVLGIDGHPLDYLSAHNDTLSGPAESVGVAGWVASSQDIKAFGYMIDDGDPVLSEEYKAVTGDDVMAAANNFGCEFASRYHLIVSTEGLKGIHKFTFLCQTADGSIFIMSTVQGDVVGFDYSADGPVATPESTKEPEGGDKAYGPGPIFRFDAEDKYVEGGLFGTSNNIDSIEFDAEKKCFVIHMENIGDPWAVMQFTLASMEDESYIVDADTYKYMQIGFRLSNPAAGLTGQIYYQTDENPGFSEPQAVSLNYKDTDELQYVNANLGRKKTWTGMMIDTRLDPLGECKGVADFEVYYVAFFENEKAATDFGDKWLEKGDEVIPTPAPTPTKAPTPEPTATPESEATSIPTPVPTEAEQATTDNGGNTEATGKGSANTGDKGEKSFPWPVIAIIGGVVVVAAIVIGIVVGKKKKK